MKDVKALLPRSIMIFLILMIICGIIFPLVITGIAQLCFHDKANGSIIEIDGKKYGSALLAQEFTGEEYLWGRIMNVDTETYVDDNGKALMYSAPSNLSPAGGEFQQLVAERTEKIKAAHPKKAGEPVPADLVTCSGSGLDPDISPAAAEYQIDRIARARDIDPSQVRETVLKYTKGRFLGIFGEPTVNVLKVNLALDGILNE